MKELILIENTQARLKAINRFSNLTALLATPYIFILYVNDLFVSSAVITFIILIFLSVAYFNRIKKYNLAKALVIIDTNLAVAYFSITLGFDSGIHLFLFSAPLITYMLFDFKQKIKITLSIAAYTLNLFTIYLIHKLEILSYNHLSENLYELLYVLNFTFSLTLCFFLIIYFANNNSLYINLLKEANTALEKQQNNLQIEMNEKAKAHTKLSETLSQKETLLSEIHHRVKNNLAVISGLLELQNYYVKDEKVNSVLKESRNRIKSIALLHEKFYENKNLDSVEIRSYIDDLINYVKLSFTNDKKIIKIHTQIDSIYLPMNNALPFSLLINELITNSYKHAFKNKNEGNIYIKVVKVNNEIIFKYKDDGVGFELSEHNLENSLGMNLIEAFTKQLNGEMKFESRKNNNSGVDFKLHFK